MMITFIFCSLINLIDWLQNHLIPCPLKTLTGIDCPGCGFQRSLILLLQGNLSKSWTLYPPTIPLISLFIFVAILYKIPVKNQSLIIKLLVIVVGNFVVISYFLKMFAF